MSFKTRGKKEDSEKESGKPDSADFKKKRHLGSEGPISSKNGEKVVLKSISSANMEKLRDIFYDSYFTKNLKDGDEDILDNLEITDASGHSRDFSSALKEFVFDALQQKFSGKCDSTTLSQRAEQLKDTVRGSKTLHDSVSELVDVIINYIVNDDPGWNERGMVGEIHNLASEYDINPPDYYRETASHPATAGLGQILIEVARNGKDISDYDISQSIPKLIELLSDESKGVRVNSSDALALAAENGADISQAIPKLAEALSDESKGVRVNSAGALVRAAENRADISQAIPKLAEALSDESKAVRVNSAGALAITAKNDADISQAIPKLAEALNDENEGVRVNSSLALARAAENGADIVSAIPTLSDMLIEDSAPNVRRSTALALAYVAVQGRNVSEIIPPLTEALDDNDEYVRINAADSLRIAVAKGFRLPGATIEKLIAALGDSNAEVRKNAAEAIVKVSGY